MVKTYDRHQISADESLGPGIEELYITHADYKALEEDRDSWRRVAEGLELKRGESLREIAHLTAELAECRKDAERLRTALQWIVDRPSTVSEAIARNALDGNEYPPKRKAAARSKT